MMNSAVPLVFTFSASDPTCGAGMQADCLTIAALGAHPLTVLTGWTAQNTHGVSSFKALSGDEIAQQVSVLDGDVCRPTAVKSGVLGSTQAVDQLADFLRRVKAPYVMDPVLASGRGDRFGDEAFIVSMRQLLFPKTALITPNWPEGQILTGQREVGSVARALLDQGCGAVLLKGEHLPGSSVVNRLYEPDGTVSEFDCERLEGQYHGSGCTLASAIAAGLAKGQSLGDAVQAGLNFTHHALAEALTIGTGQRIPQRMRCNP